MKKLMRDTLMFVGGFAAGVATMQYVGDDGRAFHPHRRAYHGRF